MLVLMTSMYTVFDQALIQPARHQLAHTLAKADTRLFLTRHGRHPHHITIPNESPLTPISELKRLGTTLCKLQHASLCTVPLPAHGACRQDVARPQRRPSTCGMGNHLPRAPVHALNPRGSCHSCRFSSQNFHLHLDGVRLELWVLKVPGNIDYWLLALGFECLQGIERDNPWRDGCAKVLAVEWAEGHHFIALNIACWIPVSIISLHVGERVLPLQSFKTTKPKICSSPSTAFTLWRIANGLPTIAANSNS